MNAKQILQATVNKAIADGSPVIVEKPTIYVALMRKLGREPTNAELSADVRRILQDGLVERAEAGKLQHQRKR